jgi:stalled ribosome rescue protein Dom34
VLGGPSAAVAAAVHEVPKSLLPRTAQRSSLWLDMPVAELKKEVETAASELTRSIQSALLDEVLDQARAGGRGALGREACELVLREQRVDTLLLSRNFIRTNPEYADHCVGTAFEQHADVEELSNEGAGRLDEEANGIAARLRYTIAGGNGDSG